MANILEISTWNQLTGARSDYNNLRILVTEYTGEDLTGTQITIADYNTNIKYFSGFVNIGESTLIPVDAKFTDDEMINIINSYGFNVRISPPTILSNNVVDILMGLYASGYRYVYKYYRDLKQLPYAIFTSVQIKNDRNDYRVSDIPNFIEDEWGWCEPFKTYPIIDLISTGTVNNGLPIS